MTENDVNPPINIDPMGKRNEFIDHPSYFDPLYIDLAQFLSNISTFTCLQLQL